MAKKIKIEANEPQIRSGIRKKFFKLVSKGKGESEIGIGTKRAVSLVNPKTRVAINIPVEKKRPNPWDPFSIDGSTGFSTNFSKNETCGLNKKKGKRDEMRKR